MTTPRGGSTRIRTSLYLATLAAVALSACGSDTKKATAAASEDAGSTQAPDATPDRPGTSLLVMDGADPGIGFDDLQFSTTLDRLLVPAGRAGYVGLVDPRTEAVTKLEGFSKGDAYVNGHDFGTTSAIEAEGLVYAIDRTAQELRQIDPESGETLAAVPLATSPDYVRFVSATRELWITEPSGSQFEIFTLGDGSPPSIELSGTMPVTAGPESLVVSTDGTTAYTNTFLGQTLVVDTVARTTTDRFSNGCSLSLGLAIDEAHSLAFIGCPQGQAVSLDLTTGEVVSTLDVGGGVDIIAFSPTLSHLYLNGSSQGELTVVGVDASGTLSLLATEPTAPSTNSSCVASDPYDNIWVCDANAGQLRRFTDVW